MKLTIQPLVIAALLVGSSLLPLAHAEEGDKDAVASSGHEHGKGWQKKMGLSDDQAAKLKDTFKAERAATKPLHRELRDALTKLRDQVEDGASDKDLQASLDRLDQARKALRGEHERFQAKLTAMLTPSQRAKMALRMARRMHRMHERRGGWGHGGRAGWKGGDSDKDAGDEKPAAPAESEE